MDISDIGAFELVDAPVPALFLTRHTARCHRCGTVLRLSGDEVAASLNVPVICWPCDRGDRNARD